MSFSKELHMSKKQISYENIQDLADVQSIVIEDIDEVEFEDFKK